MEKNWGKTDQFLDFCTGRKSVTWYLAPVVFLQSIGQCTARQFRALPRLLQFRVSLGISLSLYLFISLEPHICFSMPAFNCSGLNWLNSVWTANIKSVMRTRSLFMRALKKVKKYCKDELWWKRSDHKRETICVKMKNSEELVWGMATVLVQSAQ